MATPATVQRMSKPHNPGSLIRFDPDELRAAIRACVAEANRHEAERRRWLARAETYQRLLQLDQPEAQFGARAGVPVGAQWLQESSRLSGKTMGDAAYEVLLSTVGHTMHGRALLEALARGGRPVKGQQPMSSLQSALMRDPRFERVMTRPNTWRLAPDAKPEAEDETTE